MFAARINNAELVKTLLGYGARVNERNEAGQTALMLAAREGYVENVKVLIEGLADVNKMDDDDWTALKYARENKHENVVELLKSYGAVE
jgi:ankyrin repeat protein